MTTTMVSMIVVLGVMLGVCLTIGYVVYKDAKALGLNAVLWTVLAVFLPNFIGVIVYLVVRSTTAKKATCSVCHAKVKEDYNVCPECGSNFAVFCKSCNKPIEPGMKICPYCGEAAEDLEMPKAVKVFPQTHIAKTIGSILGVFLGAILLIIVIAFGLGSVLHHVDYAPHNLSIMNVENNTMNKCKQSFYYKNGESIKDFNINKEKALVGKVTVKQGSMTLTIKDDEEKVIFSQEFTPQEEAYTIEIPLNKTETFYSAFMTFDKTRGSIELQPE